MLLLALLINYVFIHKDIPVRTYKNQTSVWHRVALQRKSSFCNIQIGFLHRSMYSHLHSPFAPTRFCYQCSFLQKRELRQRFRGLTFLVIPFLAQIICSPVAAQKNGNSYLNLLQFGTIVSARNAYRTRLRECLLYLRIYKIR